MVGNIEKRGENSYRLRVSGGYTGNGKRIIYKKTIQTKSKTEAQKEAKKLYKNGCNLMLIFGLTIMLFQIYLQKLMKDIKVC